MANNAQALRSFFVSLGFKVDESSQRKFANQIALQTEAVRSFADALKATAEKVVKFVENMSDSMDSLYFAAQRTKASAENIRTFGQAAARAGSSAQSFVGALDSIRQKVASMGEGNATYWLRNLGIDATDASGKLLDYSQILVNALKTMDRFRKSGEDWRAKLTGDLLGIPWDLQTASVQKLIDTQQKYAEVDKRLGFSGNQGALAGNQLMNQLALLQYTFKAVSAKIAVDLLGNIQAPVQKLTNWLVTHLPQIEKAIDSVVKAFTPFIKILVKVGAVALHIIGKLLDWFNSLSAGAKKAVAGITIFVGAIGAIASAIAALMPVLSTIGELIGGLSNPIGWAVLAITGLITVWTLWGDKIKSFASLLGTKLKPAFDAVISIMKGGLSASLSNVKDLIVGVFDLLTGKFDAAEKRMRAIADRTRNFWSSVKSTVSSAMDKAGQTSGDLSKVRSIRNNNPGNLEFVGQSGATLESGVRNARFARFATAQAGMDALAKQLLLYSSRGLDTIKAIITKFAPPGENNTAAYIATVAKQLGVGAADKLNLHDPATLTNLMTAITKIEAGGNPYSRDMFNLAATHAGAVNTQSQAPIQITQHNTTTITGATDPQAVGREVSQAHDSSAQQLTRYLNRRIS